MKEEKPKLCDASEKPVEDYLIGRYIHPTLPVSICMSTSTIYTTFVESGVEFTGL